jgi:hypothetical protein
MKKSILELFVSAILSSCLTSNFELSDTENGKKTFLRVQNL